MIARIFIVGSLLAVASLSGCNRQDAECLGRIGRKVSAHAKTSSGELGAKVDLSLPKKEPSLQEKIQDRLRYDKTLDDVTLEVHAKGKEIELKGTVKRLEQRLRAIELADNVAGVEKVIDAITVRE